MSAAPESSSAQTRCAYIRPLLSDFVDGEATAAESALVDEHLLVCPACASHLAFLRATNQVIASMPEMQPSADLFARVAAATYRRPTLRDRVLGLLRPAPVRVALGSAFALGLAAVVVLPRLGPSNETTPPPIAASTHPAPVVDIPRVGDERPNSSPKPVAAAPSGQESAREAAREIASNPPPVRNGDTRRSPDSLPGGEQAPPVRIVTNTPARTMSSEPVHREDIAPRPSVDKGAGQALAQGSSGTSQGAGSQKSASASARIAIVRPPRVPLAVGNHVPQDAVPTPAPERLDVPSAVIEPESPRVALAPPTTAAITSPEPSSPVATMVASVRRPFSMKLVGMGKAETNEVIQTGVTGVNRLARGVVANNSATVPLVTSPVE
jgi:hypothetical protein